MRDIKCSQSLLRIFLVVIGIFLASSAFATTYTRNFRAYYETDASPYERTTTNYNTSPYSTANSVNGSGGTVVVKSTTYGSTTATFGTSTAGEPGVNSGSTTTNIIITPDSTHQIHSVYYTVSSPINFLNATPSTTVINSYGAYTLPITSATSNNLTYYVWVVFEPRAITITGKRFPIDYNGNADFTSDAYYCSSKGIISTTPTGTTTSVSIPGVIANTTQTIYVSNTDSTCQVNQYADTDPSVAANWSTANFTADGSGNFTSLVTDPLLASYTFYVSYSKKKFTITSMVDPAGATSCGTLTPATNSYVIGSNQTFAIIPNSNCAVDSVIVTDTQGNGGAGYTGTDVTALTRIAGNSYTFSNIQANGSITVKYALVSTTTGGQYCQVPPFISSTSTLKPNVLMIFDNSGSMADYPYVANSTTKPYTCNTSGKTTTNPTNVNCTLANINNFYGYFDNTKMYSYNATSNIFTISNSTLTYKKPSVSSCSALTDGTVLSGNAFNYLCMRKFDIVKKILVGGQVDPAKGADRYAADGVHSYYLATNDGNWVQSTVTEPTGLVQQDINLVRFGLMTYNKNSNDVGSGDGATLISPVGTDLATLVNKIEAVSGSGNTPLAESYWEAIRYFQALPSAYNAGVDYGTMDPIQYSCQKNFVIQLTDGQPTKDANVPTSTTFGVNATDANVTAWWNGLSAANKPPSSFSGNTTYPYLPRLTYYAHTNDLRTPTVGNSDIAGNQTITYYAVYAFGDGTGTATLQSAAKYGGFIDANNNNVPDGVEYPNNNNYFEADDGDVLASNLATVFSTIISSTASGTAAAVANNKSGQRGANMIQALFYPQWPNDNTVHWTGEVQDMWFYLSPNMSNSTLYEDTDGNKELNPTIDKLSPTNPFQAKALWRAGAKLQSTAAASRNIYTLLDSSSTLTAAGNVFSSANVAALKPTGMMNIAGLTDTAASTLINYLRGVDNVVYRPRVVTFVDPFSSATTTDVWKLGDVINSTPQIQSAIAINSFNAAYNDTSYSQYTGSTQYKARNVVYAGSNDGMLHAFRLGLVTSINDAANPGRIAKITGQTSNGSDLGTEEWAFIPKNALPYIQNQAGTAYCHQNLVDGAPTITDASVFKADCGEANYWDCTRKTTLNSDGSVDTTRTNWGTVLVGSMGLGGASRDIAGSCNETTVHTGVSAQNVDCVFTPVANNGLSSYFALDVSTPLTPKLMWEFSDYSIAAAADKGLGFTTPGAAVLRINSHSKTTGKPVQNTNGRWFAVFASGPTGAIGTSQFSGRSDQNLKIYIVDLNGGSTFNKCTAANQTGCNYWVKDTGVKFAYANSINGTSIDLDRWNSSKDGNYSDDVLYVTYTKATLDSSGFPTYSRSSTGGTDTPSPWDKGGVMRLVTNHNPDPFTWFTSSLIDNTGPITTAVGVLQDRKNPSVANSGQTGNLWVYFGEGRYYFPGDDLSPTRKFYGVSDPCYNQYTKSTSTYTQYTGDSYAQYGLGATAANCPAVALSDFIDQTSTISVSGTNTLPSGYKGWSVSMADANTSVSSAQTGAERVLSDVSANLNGVVYFTTFTPNTDVCVPGGTTSMWAVTYNTGGTAPIASLVGKAPVQTSGGNITLVDLSKVFTLNQNRKLNGATPVTNQDGTTTTIGALLTGMSSKDRTKSIVSNPARKMIIHSQEQ